MVYIVNNSVYGYEYRELNQELARENGELRRKLSLAKAEIALQKDEIHRRDVQILDLRRQVKEANHLQAKLNTIKGIVLDQRPIESIQCSRQTTSIHPIEDSICERGNTEPLPLPPALESERSVLSSTPSVSPSPDQSQHDDSSSTDTADETEDTTEADISSDKTQSNVLDCISEKGEEEEEEEETIRSSKEAQIHPPVGQMDSLVPDDTTSVPPFAERTMQTPSIYHILDPLESSAQKVAQEEEEEAMVSTHSPPSDLGVQISSEHSAQQKLLSQKEKTTTPSQPSPTGSGSTTCSGLRVSNNINASSPIQPITRKPNFGGLDMFHSTPVNSQKSQINTGAINVNPANNQENVAREERSQVVLNQNKPAVKKGQVRAAAAKRQASARREVTFEEPTKPATRYNLRKRAKV